MASQVGPLLCLEGSDDHSTKIFGCVAKNELLNEEVDKVKLDQKVVLFFSSVKRRLVS